MNTNFYKLKVQNIDLLTMDGKLSTNALKILCWVGNQVEDGNKANIDTKDIVTHFKMDKSVISKALKELEDGLLIKIEYSVGSDRVIAVSPTYFFKGQYELQPGLIKRWYKRIAKEHWGSVIKDTEVFLAEQDNKV